MKPSHRFVEKPMMKNMIPNLKGKKILLLGCGTGEESVLLEEFGALAQDIVGVDLSINPINIAWKTYPDIEFVIGDMNKLPFMDNQFDFVYSSFIVQHQKKFIKKYIEF